MSARMPSMSGVAAGLAVALLLVSSAAVAEPASGTRTVLSTGITVTNEPIRYPSGTPRINAVEITLAPGQQTGWHTNPVPLFGYILEGELTVDYGALGSAIAFGGERYLTTQNRLDRRKRNVVIPFSYSHHAIGLSKRECFRSSDGHATGPPSRVTGLPFAKARAERWLAIADLIAVRFAISGHGRTCIC